MKTTNNKAGFSLVELMVVVAIIGILATIAVPQFAKFTARAKQTSAKSELTGIFTAQQSFFGEYNVYHDVLDYIGFIPAGWPTVAATSCGAADPGANLGTVGFAKRDYAVGFDAATGVAQPAGAPPIACALVGYGQINAAIPNGSPRMALPTAFGAVAGPVAANPTTFTAGAEGYISSATTLTDQWSINEQKIILNDRAGF